MQRSFLKLFVGYYVPVLLWSGVIFYFSSVPDLKVGAAKISWEIILRKIAHIGEFSLLAWLAFRFAYKGHGLSLGRSLVLTLGYVLAFSISDEVHQTFVIGRAGKGIDVVIDMLGGILGLQLAIICYTKRMKKLTIAIFLIAALLVGGIVVNMVVQGKRAEQAKQVPMEAAEIGKVEIEAADEGVASQGKSPFAQPVEESDNQESKTPETKSPAEPAKKELPKKVKINVPFTSQAPYANWDAVHEDACEEASLIMVWAFLKKQSLTPEKAEQEIQALAEYQTKHLGDYIDSDMAELVAIAKAHYGLTNLKVVYDFTKEDLKRELAEGKPVLLPTAGRRLGNPNFKNPGPLYHNLVATGYEGNSIITNDPGTRNGRDFVYNEDVLFNAIHDFPGKKEQIEQGRKAMIVIE